MITPRTCHSCQAILPHDTVGGLCAACVFNACLAEDATSPKPLPTVAKVAAAFPKFQRIEYLRSGGMGHVFKIQNPGTGRDEALKLICLDDLTPAEAGHLALFDKEAKTLGKLNHPGIVTIYQSGETGGFRWFLMEFMPGGDLGRRLGDPGSTPAQKAALAHAVFAQFPALCDALHHAHTHEKGIIHRDLKPGNILLDAHDRAKLADFGLARHAHAPGHSLLRPGEIPGTSGFIAPEILDGTSKGGARSDIYALGKILQHLQRTAEAAGNPLPPGLAAIVDKALCDNPAKRYGSAMELKEALTATQAPATAAASTVPTSDDEYPTPDPASIVIEFGETSLVVNGLDFSLSTTIEDWMQVLGKYRSTEVIPEHNGDVVNYIWPHLGIAARMRLHETEKLYVAPKSANPHVLLLQEKIFRTEIQFFQAFPGVLKINGKVLQQDSTVNDLMLIDRRFAQSPPGSSSRDKNYHFEELGYSSLEKDVGAVSDLTPPYYLRQFEQDSFIHRATRLTSDSCESIYWAATAKYLCRDVADEDPGIIALISFTRLYVHNRYSQWNGLLRCGSRANDKIKLKKGERPLVRLEDRYRANKVKDGFPAEILLTNYRLIVREPSLNTEVLSFDLQSKPRFERVFFFPVSNKGIVGLLNRIMEVNGQWKICFRTDSETHDFWFSSLSGRNEVGDIIHTSYSGGTAGSLEDKTNDGRFPRSYQMSHMRLEFGQLVLFTHWLHRVTSDPLLIFPRATSSPSDSECDSPTKASHSKLSSCRACGQRVANTARTCPHCGESLRSGQKPSGWRQKVCSNCGEVMSRFAQKCQQPDCGHPNTWLKVQGTLATLAVLAGGFWCWQHYTRQPTQGLQLPLAATVLALGWRGSLSLLKSFYGH
jgi:serine/threonine protein kinase